MTDLNTITETPPTTKHHITVQSVLYVVFNFFKNKKCSHLFDPPDMQNRDENGNVKWKCCKCGKLFVEYCGLDILKNGKCTGRWGIYK